MMMLGLHFVGRIPFATVFITPLVFDLHGNKMSKSLGNAIDPMDMTAKYGADGFRFGILRQMRLESQELNFDEQKCDEARRFNNKLWNALRLLASFDEGLPARIALPPADQLTLADRWILAKLRAAIVAVTAAYDGYAMGVAADALIGFGWQTFCDWYLEATKAAAQRATRVAVATYVLDAFVRLMHPIAPFVTAEIRAHLAPDAGSIALAPWPTVDDIPYDPAAEADFDRLIAAVERLRNARAELGVAPREKLTVAAAPVLEPVADVLRLYANLELQLGGPDVPFADALASLRIVADSDALRERTQREIVRLQAEVERGRAKLANEKFVQNAKPDVVAAERAKLSDYERALAAARAAISQPQ
jgi:valyl-tRNA synthetase